MFGAIAGGIASALAGGAMSKLFGGGQKAASGGIQGDVLATDNNTVGMGDAGIKSAIQGSNVPNPDEAVPRSEERFSRNAETDLVCRLLLEKKTIADKAGALLMADMAHYAGLIAAGLYPSPIGIADFVTTTTHKTLRGPRGGLIFGAPEQEKAVNAAVFPGIQGGPLMHVIAAKAVALGEALKPEFKSYQGRVLENARAMVNVFTERGVRVVSGRTDCHMFLLDLRRLGITGRDAESALGRAHITLNKNAIPNDPQKPMVTSGVRVGTPAMTTRGFRKPEAEKLAHLICDVLETPADETRLERVAEEVRALCARFPVYA